MLRIVETETGKTNCTKEMFLIRQTKSAQNSNEMGDRERVRNEKGEEKINRRAVIWRIIDTPAMLYIR